MWYHLCFSSSFEVPDLHPHGASRNLPFIPSVSLGSASSAWLQSFYTSIWPGLQHWFIQICKHLHLLSSEITQCRPHSDPLVAFHVTELQCMGQSQKQKIWFDTSKEDNDKAPMPSEKSIWLFAFLEKILLCVTYQEEGTNWVPSDSIKRDWLWFADSCCLLADVGLHRFGFYASVFCKTNTNNLERLTRANECVFSWWNTEFSLALEWRKEERTGHNRIGTVWRYKVVSLKN